MPLRFRSVVPYTLPGVLALLGWWWYIYRKKEPIASLDSPEGTPAVMGQLASPTEGSNGLVERATAATATHRPASRDRPTKVQQQRSAEQEVIAQVHVPATKASPTLELSCGVIDLDRVEARYEKLAEPASTLPTYSREASPVLQVPQEDHNVPEKSPVPALVTEPEQRVIKEPAFAPETIVEAVVLPSQSAQNAHTSPSVADLLNAERPEPEGEVGSQEVAVPCASQPAKDIYSPINITTKDELVASAVTTVQQAQRTATPDDHHPATPTFLQASYHHILTSTPASPPSASASQAIVLDSEGSLVPQGQQQGDSAGHEDLELERLAAGLITKVISAATQEVLGVTGCQDTDIPPSCDSGTPLANGRPCSPKEPIVRDTAAQQWHLLHGGHESRGAELMEEQGRSNGCLAAPVWEVSHRLNETENTQRSHWPPSSHQAGQDTPLPSTDKLKGEEGVVDSACSTCHSEDGVSGEDFHSSVPESRLDLIQVTCTAGGDSAWPKPSAETATEAAVEALMGEHMVEAMTGEHMVAAMTGEHMVEAMTGDHMVEAMTGDHMVEAMKRLNGMGLRNGAHGTSEAETDQSGGSDVNSMDSVDSGCTMGAGDVQSSQATGQSSELVVWEIEVPKHLVGRLIGKQGRYVSFLKQSSGAKIYISTLPYTQEFQICHIEGSQQQVDKALSLIGKKFKDLDLTNLYAPPALPLSLPSLPMTSWLMLPSGVTVEVIVVNIVSAGHLFVQQHTHPTYHALRSLDQQMFLCYSQPGTPVLPSPAEVGVICAAPAVEGAWWRAQVITFYKDSSEVEIRYVDYGGYDRVKIDTLRQIRSDFVTLLFQSAEVLLDNIVTLAGEDRFSTEASSALEEMTRGVALLAQVTNYDNNSGLPLVQMWNMVGEELVSVNRTLAERGLGTWVDGF